MPADLCNLYSNIQALKITFLGCWVNHSPNKNMVQKKSVSQRHLHYKFIIVDHRYQDELTGFKLVKGLICCNRGFSFIFRYILAYIGWHRGTQGKVQISRLIGSLV
jgi:hypothetical protein